MVYKCYKEGKTQFTPHFLTVVPLLSCPTPWQPRGLQHTRLPCPSLSPRVCSNWCPFEFAQIHVHWVTDALLVSHPLSSPSPPALNLSQHQGLSSESALHITQTKYWSFSFSISSSDKYSGLISFRIDWFDLISSLPKGLSRVFSSTTIRKHQFFSTQSALWSNYHIHTWLRKNHSFDCMHLCQQSDVSAFEYTV